MTIDTEKLEQVFGPVDIDRPKCDFIHCAFGGGLGGKGWCSDGDQTDPDCFSFITSDDYEAEHLRRHLLRKEL